LVELEADRVGADDATAAFGNIGVIEQMAKQKIELQCAWEWICEDCGRNNFASAVVAEMPPDERLQFAKDQGLVEDFVSDLPDEFKDGEFMTHPTEVTCSHCGTEFDVMDFEGDSDG